MELDPWGLGVKHGSRLLWRATVEVEQPRKSSFVATVSIERVGPVRSCFRINQVSEEAALSTSCGRLTVELEYTEVRKSLAALVVSHFSAIW